MAVHGKMATITVVAGEAGDQYKAVEVDGTIAANNNVAVGLIQNGDPQSGDHLTVGYKGHMKGVAGAAIAAGARMKVTTSGFLITVSSGDGACGKCLTAASSGMVVEGIFDFTNAATTI